MVLGGLWHGASWNFVIWGALHGLALSIHRIWVKHSSNIEWPSSLLVTSMAVVLAWCLTQLFVLLSWIPFRAESSSDALVILQSFFSFAGNAEKKELFIPWAIIVLPVLFDSIFGSSILKTFRIEINPRYAVAVLGILAALVLMAIRVEVNDFIYFQF